MSELTKSILRLCGRLLCFLVVLGIGYAGVVRVVLPRLPKSVIAQTTMPKRVPVGFSRLMAEEADTLDSVDILFVGSSHAYQTFDPRFFSRYGMRAFNLSNVAQSPIQGLFLQQHYLTALKPKLVVFEVWWARLADEGAESAIDLITNMPMSFGLLRMALATHNVEVYNAFVRRVVEGRPEPKRIPREAWGLHYVSAGFAEPTYVKESSEEGTTPLTYKIQKRELRYLERMVAAAKRSGADVVLVEQPISEQMLHRITNLTEIDREMRSFAGRLGVEYLDFNKLVSLDSRSAFSDGQHLTRVGVDQFLPQFLPELEKRGLLGGLANVKASEPAGAK